MGAVQGLALPFRGFSRSGSTISTGMLAGVTKKRAEDFSFAMAVVLTPAVVGLEALRLQRASHAAMAGGAAIDLKASLVSSALGSSPSSRDSSPSSGSAAGLRVVAGTCSASIAWWLRRLSTIYMREGSDLS